MTEDRSSSVWIAMLNEAGRINQQYKPSFYSLHEGASILREEMDEFWDEVRKKRQDPAAIVNELVQIGATALVLAEYVQRKGLQR